MEQAYTKQKINVGYCENLSLEFSVMTVRSPSNQTLLRNLIKIIHLDSCTVLGPLAAKLSQSLPTSLPRQLQRRRQPLSQHHLGRANIPRPPWRPILARLAHIQVLRPLRQALSRLIGRHCSARLPVFVEAHTPRHVGAHEARVHDAHDDAAVVQVQGEQLADHVQRGLGGVVAVVAAALLGVAQRDRAGFRGDEDDLRTGADEVGARERVDYGWRGYGGGCSRAVSWGLEERRGGLRKGN